MYNRYIPQSDGSFQRSRIPDNNPPPPPSVTQDVPCSEPITAHPESSPQPQNRAQGSIGGFFRQLLPRELDAADLMIILLLLLMSEGCEQRRNHALLTLALYFFM